jgi:ketosteroid isomerase-like protein
MSQEHLDTVRAAIEHFNRESYLPPELYDPEVVFLNIPESPIPGPYYGHEGLLEWRRDLLEVLDEARFEIDDLVDVDESDLVIFRMRLKGRARHTRIAVDIGWTSINWFRDGRICRTEAHTDHADALAAAGLSG